MYGLSFDKINVIIACCEDIYGCTALKNVTMITSTHNLLLSSIKCCSFFVVKNKQTRLRFLVLEKFITCLPPEKPRDTAFTASVLKRVQRWRAS